MLSGVRVPSSLSLDLVVAAKLVAEHLRKRSGLADAARWGMLALLVLAVLPPGLPAQGTGPTVTVDSRMAAPAWAWTSCSWPSASTA